MRGYNKVILMGNLTRDPQLRYLPANNMPVVDFGLAMNRRWKTPQGEDRDETTFVDVSAFGKMAETINQYFTKGKPIFIEGRLKFDQWEDKQGGGKRSKLNVVAETFTFIGDGGASGGASGGAGGAGAGASYDSGGEAEGGGGSPPPRQQNRPPARGPGRPAPSTNERGPISEEPQFKGDDIPF